MSPLKTQPTDASVAEFLAKIEDPQRRADCEQVCQLMAEISGEVPQMWGENIVGFGKYEYTSRSRYTGAWFITGFSPRKQNLTLYILPGYGQFDALMAKLGKFKTGKSCLYLKKLADIDLDILRELLKQSVQYMRKNYPNTSSQA